MNVPEGFQPLFRSSPLLDLLGPFFCRHDAQRQLVVALRIDEKHCNHGGTAHGGLLSTLADVGLGYAMAFSREPPQPMVTVACAWTSAGSRGSATGWRCIPGSTSSASAWPSPRPGCTAASAWWPAPAACFICPEARACLPGRLP